MTAMPPGEFTAEQAAKLAEFDAAVEPAEVTREKLRMAEEALARVLALLPLWQESHDWRAAGGFDVAPHETHVAYALSVVMDDLRGAVGGPQC